MGRVKRYKKFKACDPFSKRGKAEIDTVHDEPPELFEERSRRNNRKKHDLGEEDEYELYLQREALRAKKEEAIEKQKPSIKKIEGKKEGESIKNFKQRIRQETRKALNEELKSMTATAKKRKANLKERTLKKKLKSLTSHNSSILLKDNENLNEFSSSADGRLRPSDMDGPVTFDTGDEDQPSFGETMNRLPDLNKWKNELTKQMNKKKNHNSNTSNSSSSNNNNNNSHDSGMNSHIMSSSSTTTTTNNNNDSNDISYNNNKVSSYDTNNNNNINNNDDNSESEESTTITHKHKKKKKKVPITDILSTDDHISALIYSDQFLENRKLQSAYKLMKGNNNNNATILSGKGNKSGGNNTKEIQNSAYHQNQLNKLREESRKAYQLLKMRRKQ